MGDKSNLTSGALGNDHANRRDPFEALSAGPSPRTDEPQGYMADLCARMRRDVNARAGRADHDRLFLNELDVLLGCLPRQLPDPAQRALMRLLHHTMAEMDNAR